MSSVRAQLPEIRRHDIDEVYSISVNDAFVMFQWAIESTALSSLRNAIAHRYTELVVLAAALDFVICVGLIAGLIAVIYRYLPAKRLAWRPILWGALMSPHRDPPGRVVGRNLSNFRQRPRGKLASPCRAPRPGTSIIHCA